MKMPYTLLLHGTGTFPVHIPIVMLKEIVLLSPVELSVVEISATRSAE